MPRFNQKGPNNEGPMTGRRVGRCTNFDAREISRSDNLLENFVEQIFDHGYGHGGRVCRGMGSGKGRGKRRQNRFFI